jgi:hypothetical protein
LTDSDIRRSGQRCNQPFFVTHQHFEWLIRDLNARQSRAKAEPLCSPSNRTDELRRGREDGEATLAAHGLPHRTFGNPDGLSKLLTQLIDTGIAEGRDDHSITRHGEGRRHGRDGQRGDAKLIFVNDQLCAGCGSRRFQAEAWLQVLEGDRDHPTRDGHVRIGIDKDDALHRTIINKCVAGDTLESK